jgi:hypothetical protein
MSAQGGGQLVAVVLLTSGLPILPALSRQPIVERLAH